MGYNLIPLSSCVRDQVIFSAQECEVRWGMFTCDMQEDYSWVFLHTWERESAGPSPYLVLLFSVWSSEVCQVTEDRDLWPLSRPLNSLHWQPHLGARFRAWAPSWESWVSVTWGMGVTLMLSARHQLTSPWHPRSCSTLEPFWLCYIHLYDILILKPCPVFWHLSRVSK